MLVQEKAKERIRNLTNFKIPKYPTGTPWKAERANLKTAAEIGRVLPTQVMGEFKGLQQRPERATAI